MSKHSHGSGKNTTTPRADSKTNSQDEFDQLIKRIRDQGRHRLEICVLSAILRHPPARDALRAYAGPEVFAGEDASILSAAIIFDRWSPVESSVSPKGRRYKTTMGDLVGEVLACQVPGDDEEWAVFLVKSIISRRCRVVVGEQLAYIAGRIKDRAMNDARLVSLLEGAIRLIRDGKLNDDPRSMESGQHPALVVSELPGG